MAVGNTFKTLNYSWVNQITQSEFTLRSDGRWSETESLYGTVRKKTEGKLSKAELAKVKKLLTRIDAAPEKKVQGGPTSLGSMSGGLVEVENNGRHVSIFESERADGVGRNTVTYRESPATQTLVKWIHQFVEQDMPADPTKA